MIPELTIAAALLEEGATKRLIGTFDLPKESRAKKEKPPKPKKPSPTSQHSFRNSLKSIFCKERDSRPIRRKRNCFPFLELPAELRMLVYKHYAARVHRPYESYAHSTSRLRTGNWNNAILSSYSKKQAKRKRSLLLVNRQIYREAAECIYRLPIQLHAPRCVLYDLNSNIIQAAKLLPSYTRKYPIEQLTLVLGQGTFDNIHDPDPAYAKFAHLFQLAPAVKRLQIIVTTRHPHWYPHLVGCVLEGLRSCLQVAPIGMTITFQDDDFGRRQLMSPIAAFA
jgi:hypothetical protein